MSSRPAISPAPLQHNLPRPGAGNTLLVLATDDWYVVSHRLALVRAAVAAGWRVVVAAHVGQHGPVLQATGCELVPLSWWRDAEARRPRPPLALLRDLTRLYTRIRPDVVHHVALRPVVLGTWSARLAGVQHVVNAVAGRGFVFVSDAPLARVLRPAVKLGLRSALTPPGRMRMRTIVQNADDHEFLLRERLARLEDLVLIRGAGVDLDAFTPAPRPPGDPVVVLPARMLLEKGVLEFVQAARQLRAQGVRARFVLVGGTMRDPRRFVQPDQLAAWQAEGVVEWWGQRGDMPAVFRECHLVALPSYGEGMPKALLEAAAAGLPIVTTDVAGCREAVQHEVNGLLVPPRDAGALARALLRLIENEPLRHALGARGRARAEAEFSLGGVVAETLSLYDQLLG